MKTITLTEFRSEPGERIRDVERNGLSFLLTKSGKPVAKLVPVDTGVVERRVFEGVLNHEDEMGSQDAFVIISESRLHAYWQEWVRGLDCKRVRITVEVLEDKP